MANEGCGLTNYYAKGQTGCQCPACVAKKKAYHKAASARNYRRHKGRYRESQMDRYDPVIYAFPTVVTRGDERHEVIKVGKSLKWGNRKSSYLSHGVGKASEWAMIPPGADAIIVRVKGPAEAAIAEALVTMVLKRVRKYKRPAGLKEYYIGPTLAEVSLLLCTAAEDANALVAHYLSEAM
jgi:hypothetical protein